ncbi:hypothetical protein ACFL04_01450 [Patescibacteria group bacterium]
MALVRKTNVKRYLIMSSILVAVIAIAGWWYYYSTQPLDTSTATDLVTSGRRDINKIKEFNDTDFDTSGIFGRDDYVNLESHGRPIVDYVPRGRENPFIPPQ